MFASCERLDGFGYHSVSKSGAARIFDRWHSASRRCEIPARIYPYRKALSALDQSKAERKISRLQIKKPLGVFVKNLFFDLLGERRVLADVL